MKLSLLSVLTLSCYCQLSAMEREPETPWEYEPAISLEKEFINGHRALFPDKNSFVSDEFNEEMMTAFAYDNKKTERADVADDEITQRKSKRQNIFGYCLECHKHLKDLFRHKRIVHGNASQLIACIHPDCKKQIPAYKMKRHLDNIHGDGAKLMACIHCNKQIVTYCMKQHMDVIHGDGSKLIECAHPGCNLQFKKQALKMHLKTHAMNMQDYFTCKYQACNKEFRSIRGIIHHLNKEHELSSPWRQHYDKETRMLNS